MHRKKGLILLLALLFTVMVISACGNNTDNNDNNTNENAAQKDTNQTPANTSGDTANGKEIYKNNCLACHGQEGTGGHSGPDLQKSNVSTDKDAVIKQVTDGGGNMPPFGGTLTDQEINDVAEYITTVIAPKGK